MTEDAHARAVIERYEAEQREAARADDEERAGMRGEFPREAARGDDEPRASPAPSLREFLEKARLRPEPSWLVRDLLPDEGVVVWHGRPRSMKTLTMEDVALSLALGEPQALGAARFSITEQIGVALLSEEDPARLTAFRFGLMLKARDILPGQEPDSLRLLVRRGWNLDTPAGQSALLEALHDTTAAMRTPLRVLVIDPLRASLPSIDGGPKDAASARGFLLQLLRETSVRVVWGIHHDTKPRADGQDARTRAERASGGVTFSMSDLLINFERLDDRTALAVPSSYKLGSDPKPFKVRFESETPAGEPFRGSLRAVAVTTDEEEAKASAGRDRVLSFVRERPWASTDEVEAGVQLQKGKAGQYLAQLLEAGFVRMATGDEARARGRHRNAKLWGAE